MYSFAHLNPARQCLLSSLAKCTYNTVVAIHKVQYIPLLPVCLLQETVQPAGRYHSEDSERGGSILQYKQKTAWHVYGGCRKCSYHYRKSVAK